ncbi:sugar phosphate isomerase/epimerase [Mesorhizobium sp. CGMCC 1.15528]|uniref:Sugar phosphate isomerase/epimerase n=1 Tax=Mesorhizobium zhangyense TaxID=1776730 RepID=A0A7C9R9G0_9HYPH|nr:sugar phosphate isomerase/epimerase [Mesorhizobium zhangyense]NGN42818.1 sugar phosphate isomerase/epimerase [Mesorhizobium zhangyense]
MNWSFQLYSARNFQPWNDVVKTLGWIGYREVEGFGGVYDDPAGLRAELDKNGLAMPTGHFSIDMLENDFAAAEKIATALGMKVLVCPYLVAEQRPTDSAGWQAFGKRLAAVSDKARKAGFGFAWHNHDFEFAALSDGSVPLTHILEAAPDIGWEADIAWIVRGGADPMAWIEKYGSRIIAVHVKDIARSGEGLDEDGWSDVGHGTIDWRALTAVLRDRTPAKYFIMEQDNPNNFERFARRSLEAAKSF